MIRNIASEAAEVVKIRNKFAHRPLDMDMNKEAEEFEIYLKRVSVNGKLDGEVLIRLEPENAKAKVVTDRPRGARSSVTSCACSRAKPRDYVEDSLIDIRASLDCPR